MPGPRARMIGAGLADDSCDAGIIVVRVTVPEATVVVSCNVIIEVDSSKAVLEMHQQSKVYTEKVNTYGFTVVKALLVIRGMPKYELHQG